ncbi:MAG: hypothetical protein R2695_13955 [Acidimicrobiales bacterium]
MGRHYRRSAHRSRPPPLGSLRHQWCGLVWGEATAVRPDGKANPHQLVLDATTVEDIAALRARLDPSQVTVLQLTHSGRYARPTADRPAPDAVPPSAARPAGGGR